MPRFTVLMPTHYRPDSIGYAIRSVLNQSETSFELLVVGDGASAETAGVVAGFDDPRLRWFDLPKAPALGYANRNIAMAESRGELVAFAADDDLMLPDHLERLGNLFSDPSVQWAYSQALWVSSDGIAAPDLTNLDFEDERRVFELGNTLSGGALVFRASAFPSRKVWPEQANSGDWHQMRRLLQRYGQAGMRRLNQTTFLHFTAGQKTRRDSNFALLAGWLSIADTAEWWPEVLKPDLAGQLPQAWYWQAIENDPAFVGQLRMAAADVTSRAALDALAPRAPAHPALRRLGMQEIEALTRERDDARRQFELIRGSTSWRLTAPLRAIVDWIRPRRLP